MDVPVTITTLQVKVFVWSPFDNQLFWFRDTFLQSHQLQNFRHYGDQNGHNLEGCIKWKIQAEKSKSKINLCLLAWSCYSFRALHIMLMQNYEKHSF